MKGEDEKTGRETEMLVVGLGASAGGAEALKSFFRSLPNNTGMAFIVVLHLAPEKESKLTEILQSQNKSLKVLKVTRQTEIKKDHVYVIPPDKLLSVKDNHLDLSDLEKDHGPGSVDLLFRTLAEEKEKYAAGIILSGTGSDGTSGMKVIKGRGGITLAREPGGAEYTDMPLNTIKSGVVDKVLSVKKMSDELLKYREILSEIRIFEEAEAIAKEKDTEEVLTKICGKIRARVNHDFSNYRRSSMLRRIDRRMRVNRIYSLSGYLSYLEEYPDEISLLYQDLLISVTNFFRNSEAFETLEKQVIPQLFKNKKHDEQLRVWVPGCATGEEAYSIAILLAEYAKEHLQRPPEIQVFATDVDQKALDTARAGRYPTSVKGDLTAERLQRFFRRSEQEYIIESEIRNMILFASHDILRNPPFSKLDLISCRNLLIYLNRDLQNEVFNLFHYALRPEGWLFLGKSDSRLGAENLFNPVNKEYKIYRQKPGSPSRKPLPDMPLLYNTNIAADPETRSLVRKENIEKAHMSMLAELFAPQSVLITGDHKVIHATEGISKYLQYRGGEPSQNILDMVNPDIRQPLRSLLFQLQNKKSPDAQTKVRVNITGQPEDLKLIARKFSKKEFAKESVHLLFKEIPGASDKKPEKNDTPGKGKEMSNEDAELIELLQRELEYSKEQLELSLEEYETSNEELRTSNAELQSMNEELQSTTEELETSKEELQSVNEELKGANLELEKKVEKLDRAYNDLENLMEATEVGIIFVDRDYCVRRFTSTATDIFNLMPNDKGRPLEHITHSLNYDDMLEDIQQVLDNHNDITKVVDGANNRWYIMRLHPYHSGEHGIEGAIIILTEFTELKEARETVIQQRYQESLATLGVYALEQDDLLAVMHRAVQQTCINLELESTFIARLNPEKETLEVVAETGCECEEIEIKSDAKWDLGYALQSGKPVVVSEYSRESRFVINPILEEHNFKSSVLIAIRGSEAIYGVFGFYSIKKREFTDGDLNFIQMAANIIGMAIERKQAKKRLEKANSQLREEMERSRQYQKDILKNNIIERWKLGGYLHDNLGQMLASAKIITHDIENTLEESSIEVSDQTAKLNSIIDKGIEGIRNLTHDIIPVDIEREGVEYAFHFLMRQTQKLYDINCMLKMDKVVTKIKNRKLATHLYHVVQEAIKNAVMHGEADNIMVAVSESDDHLMLQVTDDGVGVTNTRKSNGKGLRIMKYRMDLLGGSFNIEDISDAKETGARVTIKLPLEDLEGEME